MNRSHLHSRPPSTPRGAPRSCPRRRHAANPRRASSRASPLARPPSPPRPATAGARVSPSLSRGRVSPGQQDGPRTAVRLARAHTRRWGLRHGGFLGQMRRRTGPDIRASSRPRGGPSRAPARAYVRPPRRAARGGPHPPHVWAYLPAARVPSAFLVDGRVLWIPLPARAALLGRRGAPLIGGRAVRARLECFALVRGRKGLQTSRPSCADCVRTGACARGAGLRAPKPAVLVAAHGSAAQWLRLLRGHIASSARVRPLATFALRRGARPPRADIPRVPARGRGERAPGALLLLLGTRAGPRARTRARAGEIAGTRPSASGRARARAIQGVALRLLPSSRAMYTSSSTAGCPAFNCGLRHRHHAVTVYRSCAASMSRWGREPRSVLGPGRDETR